MTWSAVIDPGLLEYLFETDFNFRSMFLVESDSATTFPINTLKNWGTISSADINLFYDE